VRTRVLNSFSFALASAMMSSSVRLPTTGYRALRTISSGRASAAVASFTRIPFLPCARRNSALISPSTFFSARTLILWTSWTSSSTRPSVSSACRTWHSAASSALRIGWNDPGSSFSSCRNARPAA